MCGTVEQIFVTGQAGAPMRRVETIDADEGGLRGDRYRNGTGYYSGVDECEVTLIAAEGLDRLEAEGIAVAAGQHRRNLVVRGIDLEALRGLRFTVGPVTLVYDRPRPPCSYVERLTQKGMLKGLARHGAGICARVARPGTIRTGDAVAAELGDQSRHGTGPPPAPPASGSP